MMEMLPPCFIPAHESRVWNAKCSPPRRYIFGEPEKALDRLAPILKVRDLLSPSCSGSTPTSTRCSGTRGFRSCFRRRSDRARAADL